MTDFRHVWQEMKEQDGRQKVLIVRPVSADPKETRMKVVYEGRLQNVPADTALERTAGTDRTEEGTFVIYVEPDPTEEEAEDFRQELIEACEADPEIARRLAAYLSASEYGRQLLESQAVIAALEA